jgi:hypothetical protein
MVVDYWIGGPDQIGEAVRPGFNLMCWFTDERPRVDPVRRQCSSGNGGRLTTGCHGRSPVMGGTAATVLHSLRGFFLRLRNDAGICFTNLGQQRRAILSGRWRWSSLRLGRCLGAPLVNLQLQERDEKLAGVHLSLLFWFNSSKWR